MAQTEQTRRIGAGAVVIAPLVLLAGFALHPDIGSGFPDQDAVGAAAAEHATRWGIAHLLLAIGSGITVLAFLAIRGWLRGTGGDRWSATGVPFVVMGGLLYAFLPMMEFAPMAAAESGGDPSAAAEALVVWFVPIHVIGGLLYGVGVFAFACGIVDSALVGRRTARFIAGALVVSVLTRLAPVVALQFYVQPAAAFAALWPLAPQLWRSASPVPAGGRQSVPAGAR